MESEHDDNGIGSDTSSTVNDLLARLDESGISGHDDGNGGAQLDADTYLDLREAGPEPSGTDEIADTFPDKRLVLGMCFHPERKLSTRFKTLRCQKGNLSRWHEVPVR